MREAPDTRRVGTTFFATGPASRAADVKTQEATGGKIIPQMLSSSSIPSVLSELSAVSYAAFRVPQKVHSFPERFESFVTSPSFLSLSQLAFSLCDVFRAQKTPERPCAANHTNGSPKGDEVTFENAFGLWQCCFGFLSFPLFLFLSLSHPLIRSISL